MKSICPYCNQEYPETPDEYLGGTCECRNCHRDFVVEKVRFCRECGTANAAKATQCRQCGTAFAATVPRTIPAAPRIIPTAPRIAAAHPTAPPPVSGSGRRTYYTDADEPNVSSASSKVSGMVKKGLMTLLSLCIAAASYLLINNFNMDRSADKVARDIKEKEMTKLFQSPEFLYHGALVQEVNLKPVPGKKKTYTGEVVFRRNRADSLFNCRPLEMPVYRRPINVTYEKNFWGRELKYRYGVDFDYSRHPEFLQEDADMFFANLRRNNPGLSGWFIVGSPKVISPGIVRCRISGPQGANGEVDIKVESNGDQFTYQIIAARDLP